MEQQYEPIMRWLESHTNHTVKIRKLENEDLDETSLKLEGVVKVARSENHPDHYLADHSIILKGEGTVITNGEEVKLPINSYEIPYDAMISGLENVDGMLITTDRASYRIQLV